MQFLKKHYEKIILCVVLLSLAAAAVSMETILRRLRDEMAQPPSQPPVSSRRLAPLDLTAEEASLAQVTNPPPVVLSGEHNLFNPVMWRKKPNGELLKFTRTGPDILSVTNIVPLYTIIAYDHPTGNGAIYVFTIQQHSGKKIVEYPKKDEKTRTGLYVIRDVKGPPDNPTDIQLEILETGEKVLISPNNPYKHVDGYTVDLRYDPENHNFLKQKVGDIFTLDGEQYKIIEITNNLVRVQSIKTTKQTTINLK